MSPLRAYRLVCAVLPLTCVILGLSSVSFSQPGTNPLTKDEVLQLLKGSVSPKRVEDLALRRGIDFQITPEVESNLQQAGADSDLLGTLRVLAPKTSMLLIQATPGGVHVYVDDEPVGTTSAEGRLKLSTLLPGQHHLRLSLDGYKDDTRDVAVATGTSLELKATLEPLQPSGGAANTAPSEVPPVSKAVPADTSFEVWQAHGTWLPHSGHATLRVSSGGLELVESGERADSKYDFKLSCSDIKKVERSRISQKPGWFFCTLSLRRPTLELVPHGTTLI
jgi:hypothetical protein